MKVEGGGHYLRADNDGARAVDLLKIHCPILFCFEKFYFTSGVLCPLSFKHLSTVLSFCLAYVYFVSVSYCSDHELIQIGEIVDSYIFVSDALYLLRRLM